MGPRFLSSCGNWAIAPVCPRVGSVGNALARCDCNYHVSDHLVRSCDRRLVTGQEPMTTVQVIAYVVSVLITGTVASMLLYSALAEDQDRVERGWNPIVTYWHVIIGLFLVFCPGVNLIIVSAMVAGGLVHLGMQPVVRSKKR